MNCEWNYRLKIGHVRNSMTLWFNHFMSYYDRVKRKKPNWNTNKKKCKIEIKQDKKSNACDENCWECISVHRHSPKSVWSMHNLIYLFKALYDIHYNPSSLCYASKCASISINHPKTTIDLMRKMHWNRKFRFFCIYTQTRARADTRVQ